MPQPQSLNPLNDRSYLAETICIPKKSAARFIDYYQKVLEALQARCVRDGIGIRSGDLYRLRIKVEKHGDFEPWNFLLLLEVEDAKTAREYLCRRLAAPQFEEMTVVRRELLVSTPESNYPNPPAHILERGRSPFFAVEYVDVHEPYLDEFREIMIHNNGPAMRDILENSSWCYNMIALETAEVWEHHEHFPQWNQIHVIGLYPKSFFRYKKDFEAGLKRHAGVSFQENFSRLRQIRTMCYKTIGRRIGKITPTLFR